MTNDFNYKPYLICVLVISAISCYFSYMNAIGFLLGTLYFYISNKLNQYKYADSKSKGVAITKIFFILFIQFGLIVLIAMFSYFIGGLFAFIFSFAGIIFPHIYFIISEIGKIRK